MSKFTHVLLTRFNAKFAASWTSLALDPAWLEHRFYLFETFCYPAVRSQTNQNFIWLLFFSSDTPQQYKDRINNMAKQYPVMRPLYHDFLPGQTIKEEVLKCVPSDHEYLITSALDNDDTISRNYIEETQKQFCGQSYQFVNWAPGYIYHTDKKRFYERYYTASQFYSLIERVDGCKIVWSTMHPDILKTGTVIQLVNNPGWIQAVHSKNVTNRIKGKRINAPDIKKYFEISLDIDYQENKFEILLDRYLLYFLRLARDGAARIVQRYIDVHTIWIKLRVIKSKITGGRPSS